MILLFFFHSYFIYRSTWMHNNRIFRLRNWLTGAAAAAEHFTLCSIFFSYWLIFILSNRTTIYCVSGVRYTALAAMPLAVTQVEKEARLQFVLRFFFFYFRSQTIYGFHYAEKLKYALHASLWVRCLCSRSAGWSVAIIYWLMLLSRTLHVYDVRINMVGK